MKCPKCQYISFDSGDRCRNCGYEFSLAAEAGAAPDAPSPDLRIKNDRDTDGPLGDFSLNTPNLPLFKPESESTDAPLVAPRAAPRPPLAVRRPAPAPPRPKPKKEIAPAEPLLDLEADPLASSGFPSEREAATQPIEQPGAPEHGLVAASALARVAGGAIDVALIGAIDVLVIYFTLRICDLDFGELGTLPVAPLVSFFLLLNGGYLSAFVAAGGQTIGKMAAGTRVVPAAPEASLRRGVSFGQAVVRAGGYLVSALPAGLGFLPALAGEGRALHDRLADTRVVKA
jgi:uncharacterized RDD family membrane protein YckC